MRTLHLLGAMEEAGDGESNIRNGLKFQSVKSNAEPNKMLGVTKLHWGKQDIQYAWHVCAISCRGWKGQRADMDCVIANYDILGGHLIFLILAISKNHLCSRNRTTVPLTRSLHCM